MGKPKQRNPLLHYSFTPSPHALRAVVLRDFVPIDHVPPRLDVIGPPVLVIEIVGMLPDIDSEKRGVAFHQRAVLVRGRSHLELSALVLDQPGPAAPETFGARVSELFLERVEAAEG